MAAARRLPPAVWLLTFEAAARHQSFSRAARILGTSQPAVSQRVLHLEAELGVSLFRRLPRGVVPTPEGARLLTALQQGFGLIEEAVAELRTLGSRQRLTVVTDFGFAAFWLMPRLGSLKAAAAALDVRVLTSQAELDPRGEPVDLAIAFGRGAWRGCRADLLFPEIVLPVCAPALLGRYRPPTTLAELAALPLIHLEGDEAARWLDWPAWLEAAGSSQSPAAGHGLGLNNYILVVQAALSGQGVALGWRPLVDDLLRTGQLVAALDHPVRTERGYHLVRARGHGTSPTMERFTAWLRRQLDSSLSPAGCAALPPWPGADP